LSNINTVIEISNLSKIYKKKDGTKFFALDDINLKIKKGASIGIIGHNGAGKSTLLKILSRITKPHSGSVKIIGRIASLLEIGSGFHQELSGIENIYMNGALLGLNRKIIESKIQEIISFAEINGFENEPIKAYSSGMQVKLAFSVAIQLDPDILIIDEVLAVGDINFQNKALQYINQLREKGKTILFVTHNFSLLPKICDEVFLLHKGKIILHGPVNETVNKYLNELKMENVHDHENNLYDNDNFVLKSLGLEQSPQTNNLKLTFAIKLKNICREFYIRFKLLSNGDDILFIGNSKLVNKSFQYKDNWQKIDCLLNDIPFMTGFYYLELSIVIDDIEHYLGKVNRFYFVNSLPIKEPIEKSGILIKSHWSIHE
jgi:lipopolysaccharide transport system ATP-binding protein